jgi:hypothetical protein
VNAGPGFSYRLRLLRSLDGIAYSLLAFLLILCWPSTASLRQEVMGAAGLLPLVAMLLASLGIPRRGQLDGLDPWRLQLGAVLLVGLAPFVVWSQRGHSLYLFLMAQFAVLAFVWYVVELQRMLACVLSRLGCPWLAKQARVSRYLLIYGTLTLVVAIDFCLAALAYSPSSSIPLDGDGLWRQVPLGLRLLGLLPISHSLVVLWRSRQALVDHDFAQEMER